MYLYNGYLIKCFGHIEGLIFDIPPLFLLLKPCQTGVPHGQTVTHCGAMLKATGSRINVSPLANLPDITSKTREILRAENSGRLRAA